MSAGLLGMLALALAGTNQVPGVEGFAKQSDVAQIQQTAQAIEARIVAQDIYEARREQCWAINSHNGEAKPGPLRRLNTLMADYHRITGFAYRLPGCEEI